MFDIETSKKVGTDYFYKRLCSYGKKESLENLIRRWVRLLEDYSQYEHFITFEPKLHLLQLKPRAVGVLFVPFPITKISLSYHPISVIPLYPSRVKLKYSPISCKEGFEILHLYFDLTDIQIIGFFKIPNYLYLISELKKGYPNAHIYDRLSFSSFLTVCRLATKKVASSSGSKSQPLEKYPPVGTTLRQEGSISNPKCSDNE
ncbi:hypothetical protein AVEN_84825-1 [Araneus ventricosus]|uniref:Uncharacterized protein n=1 Tax=Araneus ventricosus TaxID=182803 RepID=A0A4Y2IX62_ARAVE|nr:hypothetical protein AVEN_84825-1 [Araneus ventricosus]